MKRILFLFSAIFLIIMNIAEPLSSSAACDWSHGWLQYEYPENLTNNNLYFQCKIKDNNDTEGSRFSFQFPSSYLDHVSNDGESVTIYLSNWVYATQTYVNTYNWEYSTQMQITEFEFDYTHNKIYFANGANQGSLSWLTQDYYVFDYDTTAFNVGPEEISLDIEFSPDLDGVVTRTETIDGKSYTSDNLQMTVTNNSSKKVQFFMSFVNVGQECTFPSVADNSTFEDYKKGFTNGSIYTYVTDEWLGISQSGISAALPNLSQNLGFSPSAWHTVQPNDTQVYNIPWSAMKLAKDELYDVVVYACWNNVDLEGTNYSGVTVSGVTEAVDLFLNDVEEVFRSTFSISDPAKFDANTEGVHAWDNDVDNSDYFNEVKAFTDDHGNLIIKDQYYDKDGNFVGGKGYNEKSNFESSSSTKNFRNSYNSFIGFVTYIFNRFPGDIKNIYYYSFLGICVLGIIKRVT